MQMMDVVHATGASARQIDYWATKGFIPTSPGMSNPGQGARRDWTPDQVTFIRTMLVLVNAGMKPDKASELVKLLVKKGEVVLGKQIKVSLV